jgi:hypothetical protein
MFIGEIPLLYETRRVSRQLKIELWLDPSPILKALNPSTVRQEKQDMPKYVA